MTNLLKNNYFLSFLASFFAFGCNFLLREGFVIVFYQQGYNNINQRPEYSNVQDNTQAVFTNARKYGIG